MDLLSIFQTLWRHKIATIPVIVVMAAGVAYVLALKSPTYQSTSSSLLMAPPAAPTSDQIARHPDLGRVRTDNPYIRFGDLSIVAELLSQQVSADTTRVMLVKQGADARYTIAPSSQFGLTTPLIQITGIGPSPRVAVNSVNLVSQALNTMLQKLQSAQGVDNRYWITTLTVSAPTPAQLQVSGKMRTLVGVLAIGMLLLFVIVSTLQALEGRKALMRARETGLLTDQLRLTLAEESFEVEEPTVGKEKPAKARQAAGAAGEEVPGVGRREASVSATNGAHSGGHDTTTESDEPETATIASRVRLGSE